MRKISVAANNEIVNPAASNSVDSHPEANRNKFGRSKPRGLSKHPLYRVWYGMKNLCHNSNVIGYDRWGGLGVRVCDEWRGSFVAFYEWAIANGWELSLQIDIIDNEGDLSPENSRFVTKRERSRNERNRRRLTHDGETLCMSTWEKRLGFRDGVIRDRLSCGWSVERALTTPQEHQVQLAFNFEMMSISEWEDKLGFKRGVVHGRINEGWSARRALMTPVSRRKKSPERLEKLRRKRNGHQLTYGGETMCISAWTERLGFSYTLIRKRLKSGWSVEDALTIPPLQSRNQSGESDDPEGNRQPVTRKERLRNKRNNHLLTFRGETLCISEWTERLGFEYTLIRKRLESGWSVERALTTSPGGRAGDCDPSRAAVQPTDVDQPSQLVQPAGDQPGSQPDSQPAQPPRDLFA